MKGRSAAVTERYPVLWRCALSDVSLRFDADFGNADASFVELLQSRYDFASVNDQPRRNYEAIQRLTSYRLWGYRSDRAWRSSRYRLRRGLDCLRRRLRRRVRSETHRAALRDLDRLKLRQAVHPRLAT